MRQRIGPIVLGLLLFLLALSLASMAFAQEADDSPVMADEDSLDATPPVSISAPDAPVLFVRVLDPATDDVEVPLGTTTLTVSGLTLAGAVVSVDGQPLDVDSQGAFSGVVPLDEGAAEIEVVASDLDGHLASTTLYVVRGE